MHRIYFVRRNGVFVCGDSIYILFMEKWHIRNYIFWVEKKTSRSSGALLMPVNSDSVLNQAEFYIIYDFI